MQRTARSKQSKPVARAVQKPIANVYYHGRERSPEGLHTVTLSVRGTRYAYTLTATQADTTEYLCKRVSARRALNYAKSRASRVVKVRT